MEQGLFQRITTTVPCRYRLRLPPGATRLALLLHGYLQSGDFVFKKFEPVIPPDWAVLAPDALFPVPRDLRSGRLSFSWYFYDPATDEYLVDMSAAEAYLYALVQQLGLASFPKTLIGYSQGGYLAPFAAATLDRVDRVIGIGCRFLGDEIQARFGGAMPAFQMDGIHGADDESVDPANAARSHAALKQAGVQGEFRLLAGEGHRISDVIADELRRLL